MEQLALTPKPHRNHYLFSDYYLDHRVQLLREWRETDVSEDFETLARQWQARQHELADVRGRIIRTDALIDQIVYRLYGLSEEEIAIVEGR